ncbi:DNA translocase FtsK [Methylobacterium persicinum]|uniref:S-DNA-T family DNA segregation ATPase FtsK/SpoIIIE n=1 Tax=Methylobacterium persicinum TaxID=374426 RepID=A0ABU0HGC4_9HYPH|nr:DNA translocase FtsK [Methylobacterium persicinum]MDQ0441368.1 S-DNA-T family DNA segregation ATPase FtsK/SpoIIIE [Methylobacterium persicinum]
MALRATLTRRLAGSAAGPSRVGYGSAGRRAEPSWTTPPTVMVGREGFERAARPGYGAEAAWPGQTGPVPAGQAWPSGIFDDRATPGASVPSRAESRIDRQASSPGVLVRQPRRPDAIAPEEPFAPVSAAPPPQASSVRFTRTPDTVLQERRQRALEAERVALERARAEAQAAAQAVEAERKAREEAQALLERQAEEAASRGEVIQSEEPMRALAGVPRWQQPFVANPGVRYFRTPDRRPTPVQAVPAAAAPAPEPAPEPRDWSDLSDWSHSQPWFGGDDWSSVDVWASLESPPAEAPPAATPVAEPVSTIAMPLDISLLRALPPRPAYGLDRLVRFDQPPRPAAGQDNRHEAPQEAVHEAGQETAPALRPALSLVFGPQGESEAPAAAPHSASRRPTVPCAMAARAAIRTASSPVQAPVSDATVPAAPASTEVRSEERVVIPLAPRPVLLRGRAAPAPEPTFLAEEPVEAQVVEMAPPAPVAPEAPAQDFAAQETSIQQEASVPAVAPATSNVPLVAARPRMIAAPRHLEIASFDNADYELPSLDLLALPAPGASEEVDADVLEQNALNLQQTVQDFGVRGDILAVRPGPVVTLYELEPAPGTKSSRVIALSDDIARSMSAVSARVAVVPGRNVIGIELPNEVRETVYLRELLCAPDFAETKHKLALCLGKNIGGEPIIADLARMPHLLVAGTTGSGKSVAINTMILSLLYRMKPEECRLIMVDPKMLELSVYDGIPHLLSPVVIDPKKAVIALKWAVREMEERYKKMSKIAVRNIDGYNARMKEARDRGETITRTVQTGVNRETGEVIYEQEAMDLSALPYIVIVVDEMADLMMVAGKDIEGAIQRLAQMARAAGIHLIMATQRPSVDVITGTIKANFPTRISFQVTSKIDSRTILGEMGAEQLLGQGDMLFMAGGGRTTRVHGPFCSDAEVESVVAHLKRQGRPSYLDAVTADDTPEEAPKETGRRGKAAEKAERAEEPEEDAPVFDIGAFAAATGGESDDLYKQAIEVVLRDQKASTSYIQRRLQIGYNRAASIMERMEIEGIVGPANHAGKREILVAGAAHGAGVMYDDE